MFAHLKHGMRVFFLYTFLDIKFAFFFVLCISVCYCIFLHFVFVDVWLERYEELLLCEKGDGAHIYCLQMCILKNVFLFVIFYFMFWAFGFVVFVNLRS